MYIFIHFTKISMRYYSLHYGFAFHTGQTTSGANKDESSNQNTISDSNNNNNPNETQQPNEQPSDLPVVREQDNYPPIANVIRIMRRILPPHAKISEEAKEIVQESVSEFIGFVTAEANERCRMEQRRTVTANDLILAMDRLGFDDYVGPLSRYLSRYRKHENQLFNGNLQEPAGQQQSMPNSQQTRMAETPRLGPLVSNTEGIYFPPIGEYLKSVEIFLQCASFNEIFYL